MADDGLDDLLDSIFAVISQDQEGVPSYRELRKTFLSKGVNAAASAALENPAAARLLAAADARDTTSHVMRCWALGWPSRR
jgi:hypothetical protein